MLKTFHILKAYLLLASIATGVVMPLLHTFDHGSDHHEEEIHQCNSNICLDDAHRESIEHCANDTHLYCAVCDLFAPLINTESEPLNSVGWCFGTFDVAFAPCVAFSELPNQILGRAPPLNTCFSI